MHQTFCHIGIVSDEYIKPSIAAHLDKNDAAINHLHNGNTVRTTVDLDEEGGSLNKILDELKRDSRTKHLPIIQRQLERLREVAVYHPDIYSNVISRLYKELSALVQDHRMVTGEAACLVVSSSFFTNRNEEDMFMADFGKRVRWISPERPEGEEQPTTWGMHERCETHGVSVLCLSDAKSPTHLLNRPPRSA